MAAVAIAAGLAAGTNQPAGKPSNTARAKVFLKVEGMTCGGCVSTIQSSLADFDGIADIQVDVAAGTTTVLYDSRKITDVDKMARAITASGYPTTVTRVVAAAELQREKKMAEQKSHKAIAAVGSLEIARSDFEAEISHARSRYAAMYGPTAMEGTQGRRLMDNIKRQVAQRLIQDGIQLQEIQRVGYRIDPADLEREFDSYLQERNLSRASFAAELEKNGMTITYFMKKFRQRVLIGRYIDEEVLPANLSDVEKQRHYADWFANARLMAGVTFYDPDIERLVKRPAAGGGCGSSCSTGR